MTVYAHFDPSALFAGDMQPAHRGITLAAGQLLKRGAVLGMIGVGTPVTSAPKAGGNTGNGVITIDPTNPTLANAKPGVYRAVCIAASANAATFRVSDPMGGVLGDMAYNGSGAISSFADRIKFTIQDGSTDFVVGDEFDVTVPDDASKYTLSVLTAADGSQDPRAVLAADTDATAGDTVAPAYFSGEFASELLTYGTGHTMQSVEAAFASRGQPIFIKSIGVLG